MHVLKQSLKRTLVLAFAALISSACTSPAVVENMVVTPKDVRDISPSLVFNNGIAIVQIDKGNETNSLLNLKVDKASFQKALSASLQQNRLLAVPQSLSKFNLFANIESLTQPFFGGDFKVISKIKYKVVERDTKITWYEELIVASYTTAYSSTGLPVGEMRIANEGAIRKNIKKFITRLSKKNPPNVNGAGGTLSVPNPSSAIQKLHDLQ